MAASRVISTWSWGHSLSAPSPCRSWRRTAAVTGQRLWAWAPAC